MPKPLAFLDLETTGLDPLRHGVLQIGVYKVYESSEPAVSYSRLVKPYGYEIDASALQINGLSIDRCAAEGISLEDAAIELTSVLRDTTVLCWNVSFDTAFLRTFYHHAKMEYPIVRPICVLSLGWPLFLRGQIRSLSLDSIGEHFGMARRTGTHDALDDARRTYAIYQKLIAGGY